jgi:hypothetical protein
MKGRATAALMTAALLLVVTACDGEDDTPNEPQEQIDEGDVDQVEDDL